MFVWKQKPLHIKTDFMLLFFNVNVVDNVPFVSVILVYMIQQPLCLLVVLFLYVFVSVWLCVLKIFIKNCKKYLAATMEDPPQMVQATIQGLSCRISRGKAGDRSLDDDNSEKTNFLYP